MTISVVVPVYNSAATLSRCLAAVCASRYADYECIVVDDGSTDGSGTIAKSFPVRVVEVAAGPRGAAAARNRGAEAARGDVVLFVDADVVLQSDTMAKVAADFSERPDIAAVFGSYDDRPADPSFLSQYKNLSHHFVHQHAREEAATFWGGCGAIRKDAFVAIGGFDEVRYSRSSIEDIDLGYRLAASGRKVRLNKQLQVQHLKRWTLGGMVVSDIRDRALPWTRAILEHRTLPNDLNLRIPQRLCALLICLLLVYLAAIPVIRPAASLHVAGLGLLASTFVLTLGNWRGGAADGRPRGSVLFGLAVLAFLAAAGALLLSLSWPIGLPVVGVVLLIVSVNSTFFVFFARKRGILFAVASVPFFLCQYVYAATAFLAGVALYLLERLRNGRRSSWCWPPEADAARRRRASPGRRDGPPIRTDG